MNKNNIMDEIVGLEDTKILYNIVVVRNKTKMFYKNQTYEALKKILKYHKEECGREVMYSEVE